MNSLSELKRTPGSSVKSSSYSVIMGFSVRPISAAASLRTESILLLRVRSGVRVTVGVRIRVRVRVRLRVKKRVR